MFKMCNRWGVALGVLMGMLMLSKVRGAETPVPTAPATDMIRYQGVDRVVLSYPDTWVRIPGKYREKVPNATNVLMMARSVNTGRGVIVEPDGPALTYMAIDLNVLPEDYRNARSMAESAVTAARQRDPQGVAQDIKETRLGGEPAYYYVLRHFDADGKAMLVDSWTVKVGESLLMFMGTSSAGAEARRQIQGIIESVRIWEKIPAEDGKTIVFRDRAARLSMQVPSHWLDEPPSGAGLAQWAVPGTEGDRQATIQLVSSEWADKSGNLEAILAHFRQRVATTTGATIAEPPVRISETSGFKGYRQILRGVVEGKQRTACISFVYKDGWIVVFGSVITGGDHAKHVAQWDAALKTIDLDAAGRAAGETQ